MDKIRRENAQKVIVAMSGGLDSSVAAALLKRAGFDVIGIFMKFWMAPGDKLRGWNNRCCSPEAETRVRKVAKILKIPFYVYNFEKEFKKRIVDYFLDEHKKGITPNPCVVCNKEIKFGLLLKKALALNADFVATGHYTRKREVKNQGSKVKIYKLLRAKDRNKDQSYFLWKLNQKQLERILFPVGDYTRKEVEKMARKLKLPVLNIHKSVEICFIQTTVEDFLKKYLKSKPGKIVNRRGEIMGKHQGLHFYTIGQRKGLGISGGPYYVLDKDFKKNILIVTKKENDLYKKELIVKDINWISGEEPKLPLKIKAKIRYRHKPTSAILTHHLKSKTYHLKFGKPQRAITPGQSAVFFKNQELLGGGIIC
jgi:tRNA-specific 2-thiouridylase